MAPASNLAFSKPLYFVMYFVDVDGINDNWQKLCVVG